MCNLKNLLLSIILLSFFYPFSLVKFDIFSFFFLISNFILALTTIEFWIRSFSMLKRKKTLLVNVFIFSWQIDISFSRFINNPFEQSQDYSPKLKRFYTATVELNERVALGEHKSFLVARFHEGELLSINFSGVNSRWKSFVS